MTNFRILDPPRIGLSKEARNALIAREPRRIVSVSCDPATGARDVGALVKAGWELNRLRAVDLFVVVRDANDQGSVVVDAVRFE